MLEDGRVGGGWYGRGWMGSSPQGNSHVGETATVWDGEIEGMARAVESFEKGERILLLVDSRAAISAVKKAGRMGKARTRELVGLMRTIREREEENGKGAVAVGWVKSQNSWERDGGQDGQEGGREKSGDPAGHRRRHPTKGQGMEEGGETGGGLWERESGVLEPVADHNVFTTPDQQRGPAVMET